MRTAVAAASFPAGFTHGAAFLAGRLCRAFWRQKGGKLVREESDGLLPRVLGRGASVPAHDLVARYDPNHYLPPLYLALPLLHLLEEITGVIDKIIIAQPFFL